MCRSDNGIKPATPPTRLRTVRLRRGRRHWPGTLWLQRNREKGRSQLASEVEYTDKRNHDTDDGRSHDRVCCVQKLLSPSVHGLALALVRMHSCFWTIATASASCSCARTIAQVAPATVTCIGRCCAASHTIAVRFSVFHQDLSGQSSLILEPKKEMYHELYEH